MGMEIRQFGLIGVSIFEVWLCYRLLACTVIKEKYLYIRDKIVMWLSILLAGVLLGNNRKLVFFSYTMFFIVFALTSLSGWIIKGKEGILITEIVVSYYSLVALLDFFWSFISMIFLKQYFIREYFRSPQTWYTFFIFLCSRILVFIVFVYTEKKFNEKIIIETF